MSPRTKDPLIGTILADDFRIVRLLGLGGHAKVYLAEQLSLGRRNVAVKVLHVTDKGVSLRLASSAMKREAVYMASLKSPVFPRVFKMGTTPDSRPYFVMEHVGGKTLDILLQENGPLEPGVALGILVELCTGLAEMHQRDLLHRDVKPANIAIEEAPKGVLRPKILDIGSTKPAYKGDAASSRTFGFYHGTPAYMAPETAREGIHSEASDVYGLGCVAYEMLTGIKVLHLKDATAKGYIDYLRSDKPIPVYRIATIRPEVPEEVEDVVQKALARDPNKRYPTAVAMLNALKGLSTGQGSPNGLVWPRLSHAPSTIEQRPHSVSLVDRILGLLPSRPKKTRQ